MRKKAKLFVWKEDFKRRLYFNKDKTVTWEQLEKYRGKYKELSDTLFEAIWIISNLNDLFNPKNKRICQNV